METFWAVVTVINDITWHQYVLYVLLAVGVLFTVWTGFGQYRALTHGVQVIRGVYDDKNDPGAINHFQALSTALSATVGLGNIAGVAIAISLGGPGAVFWMWVVGVIGMCLKMTEVTQAMLFRDTSDPDNPHGGAMWVCKKGLSQIHPSLGPLGLVIGGIFCVTLIISCLTGGNMFQAWNVADITQKYFGVPKYVTGVVLTVSVGLVILGGIKRIGDVAGRLVPFMCLIYVLAGLYVIAVNITEVPAIFALIVKDAFAPSQASGAFIGGTVGYGFLKGMQRALFSNEAGQGSAPIAHAAAKTDEPVREGIVAGLGPFIDTLCVCTITALVILLSGAWDRGPALAFADGTPSLREVVLEDGSSAWQIEPCALTVSDVAESKNQTFDGAALFVVLDGGTNETTGGERHRVFGTLQVDASGQLRAEFEPFVAPSRPNIAIDGAYLDYNGATLTAKAFDRTLPGLGFWMIPAVAWLFAFSTIISWSYYGEQGVVFLLGARSVLPYRIIYCLLILVTAQLVRTQDELDVLSALGTGVMLWANIPIMLIFGPIAMKAYREYFRRLDSGEMDPPHRAPRITDVVEGHDIE
ncbi:MAG: sodium:alanine symporter family protein [Candidatus Eisenbacteria bacterium]|uniref:Sodium:alanine symporter family protein n=1 Tax=Eiseniibacteriota bacterium TaxID=2212470 RepID=A0A956SFL8_UNCEI|nr:sodium:alanine symporter family protein [Candidatus Eisenbacteria bacterium]MCB9462086.1 sodium:alanine symporter family protein [Candidatus Eisenbacteria bacterium]